MQHGQSRGQIHQQTCIDNLVEQGVVQKTTANGETLCELYSLLECLEPDVDHLAACLKQVRLVPTREDVLGLYLVYIPLADVLTYLIPVCRGRRSENVGTTWALTPKPQTVDHDAASNHQ